MAFVPSLSLSIPMVTHRLPFYRGGDGGVSREILSRFSGRRTHRVRRYSGASPSARGLLARKRSANKPEKIEADLLFPGTKSLKSILKYCNTRFL